MYQRSQENSNNNFEASKTKLRTDFEQNVVLTSGNNSRVNMINRKLNKLQKARREVINYLNASADEREDSRKQTIWTVFKWYKKKKFTIRKLNKS